MDDSVNAANIAYTHHWKLPRESNSAADRQSFHMEGDNKEALVLDGHRLKFAWEVT